MCSDVMQAMQGGADRRGIEEANRRPASVKASLSVALGMVLLVSLDRHIIT